jgi:hypothetical protein
LSQFPCPASDVGLSGFENYNFALDCSWNFKPPKCLLIRQENVSAGLFLLLREINFLKQSVKRRISLFVQSNPAATGHQKA